MAEQDDFTKRPGINSPDTMVSVTPSDSVDLPFLATCFWVGSAGSIALLNKAGTSVVFGSVPAGAFFIARSTRVMATGTTATGIVACR